jgi:hypothetical protein
MSRAERSNIICRLLFLGQRSSLMEKMERPAEKGHTSPLVFSVAGMVEPYQKSEGVRTRARRVSQSGKISILMDTRR